MINTITNFGREYVARMTAGGTPINIHSLKLGDGVVVSEQEAANLLNLKSSKKSAGILKNSSSGNVITIETNMDNIGLTEGFETKEVGIFVNDGGTEKLLWYINYENASSYLQSEAQGIVRIDLSYDLVVAGNNVEVAVTEGDRVFATKTYVDEKTLVLTNKITDEINKHNQKFHSEFIKHLFRFSNTETGTNGYTIFTKLPYNENCMYTVVLVGYAYGEQMPIDTKISFYTYQNTVTSHKAIHAGWNPGTITFCHDNGDIRIHLENNCYFLSVNAYLLVGTNGSTSDARSTGWYMQHGVAKSGSTQVVCSTKILAGTTDIDWNNVSSKPSSFPPSTHTHDDRYYTEDECRNTFIKQKVKNFQTDDWNNIIEPGVYRIDNMTGANRPSSAYTWGVLFVMRFDNSVTQVYYAHSAASTGGIYTRTKFNATDWCAWITMYGSHNFNPAGKLDTGAKAADSSRLNGAANSTAASGNTIAHRDGAGDVHMRLLRSEYGFQGDIYGGIAFRGAAGANTDNYVRFCNNPTAVRNWLGGNHRGKADLLWSGGHYMDGGAVLSLGGVNFDQYQLICIYVSCENNDAVGSNLAGQMQCPTAQYGSPSYDWVDITGNDWAGAYLINNYQIKPYGGAGVWIRRVVGVR